MDEVQYAFQGVPGDVIIHYQVWDADLYHEVEILVNGVHVGFAPSTADSFWGPIRHITLPDELVNEDSVNVITFANVYNPPADYWWGVGNVGF